MSSLACITASLVGQMMALCSQSLGWRTPSATHIARSSGESTTCTARGRVMRVVSTSMGSPGISALPMAREGGVLPRSHVVGECEVLRVLDVFPPGLEGEVRHLLHAGVAYHGRDLSKVAHQAEEPRVVAREVAARPLHGLQGCARCVRGLVPDDEARGPHQAAVVCLSLERGGGVCRGHGTSSLKVACTVRPPGSTVAARPDHAMGSAISWRARTSARTVLNRSVLPVPAGPSR